MTQGLFNQLSDAYDTYRPNYPPALYAFLRERLALARDARLTDVACGTGKSTLPLCNLSHHVTGIESAPNMLFHARRRAAEAHCNVNWVLARAEDTGLFSASQDLVTVAQAFHWFEPSALDELVRVLKASGALAIYWNLPGAPDAPYYEAVQALIRRHNPEGPLSYAPMAETPARLARHGGFADVETHRFAHVVPYTFDQYVGYQASRSFVGGVLQGDAWQAFVTELRALLGRHWPDGIVEEAYVTELTLGLKAPAAPRSGG